MLMVSTLSFSLEVHFYKVFVTTIELLNNKALIKSYFTSNSKPWSCDFVKVCKVMASKKKQMKSKPKKRSSPKATKSKSRLKGKKFYSKLRKKLEALARRREDVAKSRKELNVDTKSTSTSLGTGFFQQQQGDQTKTLKLNGNKISNRHKALALLHNHMVELEVRFQRDVFALEEQYAATFYRPLNALRRLLTKKTINPKESTSCNVLEACKECFPNASKNFASLQMYTKAFLETESSNSHEKCNNFWLVVLLHSEPILRSLIQSRDIEILRYLADVRIHEKINESAPLSSDASLNDSHAVVFDIVFEFFPNPHFTNTELRKRYVIDLLPDQCDYVVASHCDVIQPDSAEEGDADAEDSDECCPKVRIKKRGRRSDRLLNYLGPQVVAIEGCLIDWSTPKNAENSGAAIGEMFSSKISESHSSTSLPNKGGCMSSTLSLSDEKKEYDVPSSDVLKQVADFPQDNKSKEDLNPKLSFSSSNDQKFLSKTENYFKNGQVLPNKFAKSKKCLSQFDFKFLSNETSLSDNQEFQPTLRPSKSSSVFFTPPCETPKHADLITSALKPPNQTLSAPPKLSSLIQNNETTPPSRRLSQPVSLCFPISLTDPCTSYINTSCDKDIELNPSSFQGPNPSANNELSPFNSSGFFDFFTFNWNHKQTTKNANQIHRDYQIASYIKDVMVPRAYLLFRKNEFNDSRTDPIDNCSVVSSSYSGDETGMTPIPAGRSNYDDIDEDIPFSVSKQALSMMQNCDSVKAEVFRHIETTAAQIARSDFERLLQSQENEINSTHSYPSKWNFVPSSLCDPSFLQNVPDGSIASPYSNNRPRADVSSEASFIEAREARSSEEYMNAIDGCKIHTAAQEPISKDGLGAKGILPLNKPSTSDSVYYNSFSHHSIYYNASSHPFDRDHASVTNDFPRPCATSRSKPTILRLNSDIKSSISQRTLEEESIYFDANSNSISNEKNRILSNEPRKLSKQIVSCPHPSSGRRGKCSRVTADFDSETEDFDFQPYSSSFSESSCAQQ